MHRRPADILLINKDLASMEFAVSILKNEGFQVYTASTMRDALGFINKRPVGLIMCGPELEDISGEHFLSFLKKKPLRASIPFIFLLSLEIQNRLNPKRAIQMGAEDIIFLPTDESTLVSRIREIWQSSQPDSMGASAYSGKPEKKKAVTASGAGETGSYEKPRSDRREEKGKQTKQPIAIEVSIGGEYWTPGIIINTSKSSVMIETTMRVGPGVKVLIRKPKEENNGVVTGTVAHILQGDRSKQIGIGVIFYENSRWSSFYEYLLSTSAKQKQAVGHNKPAVFSINIEVSRDGFLWVDAQIVDCDVKSAHIKTFMLGKPEEKMRIKFELYETNNIVAGKIKKVELKNGEMFAEIELDFDEDSGWPEMFAQFATLPDPALAAKSRPVPLRPRSETITAETKADKDSTSEQWAKTIFLENDTDQKPEPSIKKKDARQNSAATNKRFYQSLIGRKMDNYEVVSFISSGSMGGVFKGFDTALERDVALKVVSWELASQERFVEMFFKEARFASKLNHPNISQIYHIGNANGTLYYAMEFVHGENLLELSKKKVRFTTDQVVKYLKIVCRALDYVWKNKIIHRDIKPANIMLTSDESLKIVDFGVAKFEKKGANQSEAYIVGSPLYLSPETIRNQKVDHRSDIYSLGATFYHLIAGSPPYFDTSMRKTLHKHLEDPVPVLKSAAPDVPEYLSDAVEKMMAKKAENRFQDYQELIDYLENFPAT